MTAMAEIISAPGFAALVDGVSSSMERAIASDAPFILTVVGDLTPATPDEPPPDTPTGVLEAYLEAVDLMSDWARAHGFVEADVQDAVFLSVARRDGREAVMRHVWRTKLGRELSD